MTAGVVCKFTVRFSTSFSTTRTSLGKDGTLLSCRRSHSRLRHLLHDFGECRFGQLLFCFPLTQYPVISRVGGVYWPIWIMYSGSKRAYRHSVALNTSRNLDTYIPRP